MSKSLFSFLSSYFFIFLSSYLLLLLLLFLSFYLFSLYPSAFVLFQTFVSKGLFLFYIIILSFYQPIFLNNSFFFFFPSVFLCAWFLSPSSTCVCSNLWSLKNVTNDNCCYVWWLLGPISVLRLLRDLFLVRLFKLKSQDISEFLI